MGTSGLSWAWEGIWEAEKGIVTQGAVSREELHSEGPEG